jgi:hypothetical protein
VSQPSSHFELQQTPSAQKPLAQSPELVHAIPRLVSTTQDPASQ